MTMKKTDLEKFKAKKLGNRLSREQATRRLAQGAPLPATGDAAPVKGLVGLLLRKALGEDPAG